MPEAGHLHLQPLGIGLSQGPGIGDSCMEQQGGLLRSQLGGAHQASLGVDPQEAGFAGHPGAGQNPQLLLREVGHLGPGGEPRRQQGSALPMKMSWQLLQTLGDWSAQEGLI